jgi:choline dehydrogenase-like flavoprotein
MNRFRLATLFKGSVRPPENDSAWLLDEHRRMIPGHANMRRYDDADEVDMLIVGAGAGGSTLAQRLARRGWRVVVLEAGPFWDPDRDWVSDEAGAHPLYWTMKRITGGRNAVALGKNNSGIGVGGSMVHFAGYMPRFHPSDFRTESLDGVGKDWPLTYWDLKKHFEVCELEAPVAGQFWPWGDPHGYPHSPHPVSLHGLTIWEGARRLGIEMRAGPVGITNGVMGHRPHCIYRGYCLQGCKVNAKASPYTTHLPDAIAHGVEVRAESFACRVEVKGGRSTGVEYIDVKSGRHRFQRAKAVAIAGYSIETPRLLLNSGVGNENDQVGRYVMVQGASQVAGRFPFEIRMYKAPPPEVSSEQFYETDRQRGFARGFSLQTVSPLPIAWAEHVVADGHWGPALREYMRDYNHWAVLGVLCELLPLPENRVTLATAKDQFGLPVAHFHYEHCENDQRNIEYATEVMREIWLEAGAQDTLTIDRHAHLVGGCRMGTSPEDSVCNSDHQVWGVANLFLADGSVFCTQGAANPALVIQALASRLAERLTSGQVKAAASPERAAVSVA